MQKPSRRDVIASKYKEKGRVTGLSGKKKKILKG